jgi:hypothetical protein
MAHDMRLHKLMASLGIQSASDVLGHTLENILAKNSRLGRGSYGVQVNNPEVAIMVIEHLRPIPNSS